MEEVIISVNGKLTQENLKSMLSGVLPADSVDVVARELKEMWRNVANKVYICSPLHAPTQEQMKYNMLAAGEYEREAETAFNVRGIATHLVLPKYLDDNNPKLRKIALDAGLDVLSKCQCVFVCGTRITEGMAGEIKYAIKLKKPIILFRENLKDEVIKIALNVTDNVVLGTGHSGIMSMDSQILGSWQACRIREGRA